MTTGDDAVKDVNVDDQLTSYELTNRSVRRRSCPTGLRTGAVAVAMARVALDGTREAERGVVEAAVRADAEPASMAQVILPAREFAVLNQLQDVTGIFGWVAWAVRTKRCITARWS